MSFLDTDLSKAAETADVRKARIETRGTAASFFAKYESNDPSVASIEDGKFFGRMLSRAYGDIEDLAKTKKRFDEKFEFGPIYAMQWSGDLFEFSAKAALANELINMFDHGSSKASIIRAIVSDLKRRSLNLTSRSTSPTSNLIDDAMIQAHAKFLDGLDWE